MVVMMLVVEPKEESGSSSKTLLNTRLFMTTYSYSLTCRLVQAVCMVQERIRLSIVKLTASLKVVADTGMIVQRDGIHTVFLQ